MTSKYIHYVKMAGNPFGRCGAGGGKATRTKDPSKVTCPKCLEEMKRDSEYKTGKVQDIRRKLLCQ